MKIKNLITGFFISILLGISFLHIPVSYANLIDIPFNGNDINLYNFPSDESNTRITNPGIQQINDTLFAIINWFRYILGIVATIWVVWEGYQMLSAGEDDSKFTNAKKSIVWGVIGLVISFLIEPAVRTVLYGGGGGLTPGQAILDPATATAVGRTQLQGFMNWIKTMLGIIAVAMIIITGLKAMFSLGGEDETKKQKTNITWIVIGILIIIFNDILVNFGIYGDPHLENNKPVFVRDANRIITEFGGFIGWGLTFFATIAISGMVYGGYKMLIDNKPDEGKKIIQFIVIGIVLVLTSYALVRTVIFLQS